MDFDFTSLSNYLGIKPDEINQSYSLNSTGYLLQPFIKGNELMAYLHAGSIGYGRLWGRFLTGFPDLVTVALQKRNQTIQNDSILMELTDDSHNNASLHLPLTDAAFEIPGGRFVSEEKFQKIGIEDIEIRWQENRQELEFWSIQYQRKIIPINLGLEAVQFRSPLLQILHSFSPSSPSFANLINWIKLPRHSILSKSFITPRLVFENRIVLKRKRWVISKVDLLSKNAGESDFEFYIRLNNWRDEIDLPRRAFLTIHDRSFQKSIHEDEIEIQREWMKPQFIDFENPFMVRYFLNACKKVPYKLVIEEVLPNSSQLIKEREGRKRALEFGIEIDRLL